MTEALAAAEARFLAPANLTEGQLAAQLGAMLRGDIDFADLYFQHAEQQAFVLEDGRVRDASFSIDHGVGLRAVAGAKTGFAYATASMRRRLRLRPTRRAPSPMDGVRRGKRWPSRPLRGRRRSTLAITPWRPFPTRPRRHGSGPSTPSLAPSMRASLR